MISPPTRLSSATANFQQLFRNMQTFLYRISGGLVGYRFTWDTLGGHGGPGRMLLLTTSEQGSGQVNTIPLTYFQDGEDFFVVAFHAGSTRQPTWYLNLKNHPQAEIQIKTRHQPVTGTIATTEERRRLFAQITALAPNYARYQQGSSREVPVAVLHTA
ncbi:MAG: nitroreductase/quinone reductase family protein [Ktedonobacterales bacterium]